MLLLAVSALQLHAQPAELPFKAGESIRYGAYFNWGVLWLQSGEVNFRVAAAKFDNQPSYHLYAEGFTYKAYDLFYRIRDTFQVYATMDDFRPLSYQRVINHGKERSAQSYRFDHHRMEVYSQVHTDKGTVLHDTIPIQTGIRDMLSTAYFFRTFPFSQYRIGQQLQYQMLAENRIHTLYFTYLGTETVKTRNNRVFRCHVISAKLMEGDFFPEGEHMKVWFSDDRNRIPVQAETKIIIGSVKALLLDAESLKYPLSSEIIK